MPLSMEIKTWWKYTSLINFIFKDNKIGILKKLSLEATDF